MNEVDRYSIDIKDTIRLVQGISNPQPLLNNINVGVIYSTFNFCGCNIDIIISI